MSLNLYRELCQQLILTTLAIVAMAALGIGLGAILVALSLFVRRSI